MLKITKLPSVVPVENSEWNSRQIDEGYFIGPEFVGPFIINTVEGAIPQLHVDKVSFKSTNARYRLTTANIKTLAKLVTDGSRNQYF